jgi:hypothetical protein
MNGTESNEGKVAILTAQLAAAPVAGMQMGLLTSTVPTDGTGTLADCVAAEASWSGYARQAVSGWSTPTLQTDHSAASSSGTVTFSNTGGTTTPAITGWFWVDPSNTFTLFIGAYSPTFTIIAGGTFPTVATWDRQGNP